MEPPQVDPQPQPQPFNYSIGLKWLVEDAARESDWSVVRNRIQANPEEVKLVDELTGRTILHQLCSTSTSPPDLVNEVASIYPEATRMQEKTYMATPLHILCWTSQRSMRKVETVLSYMTEEDVLLQNLYGGTALHSACGSNAWIVVIRILVEKNRSILLKRTYEYSHTALTALWQSYLQSIPGMMAIATILKGNKVESGLFEKFWAKVELLACESFKLSQLCPDKNDQSTEYLLHGLLFLRAPLKLIKVALRRNREWAALADVNGNYPLHKVIMDRPFRLKDVEVIQDLLAAFPKAAEISNNDGDLPVILSIRDKIAWEEGLGDIVEANTDALALPDKSTGLYPFLLAATVDGRVALNTTYELLCSKPYLVKAAHQ